MSNPFYQDNLVTIYHKDFMEQTEIEEGSVNAVITDPPYGSKMEWDNATWGFQEAWLSLCHSLLGDTGIIYFFFAPLKLRRILGIAENLFKLQNVLVWHHANLFGHGTSYGKARWKSTWEAIIYASKEYPPKLRAFERTGAGFDVFNAPYASKRHRATKPEDVITRLILASTEIDDLILEPFLGSGTVAWCCKKLGRKCVAYDREEEFCEMSADRCRQTVMSLGEVV